MSGRIRGALLLLGCASLVPSILLFDLDLGSRIGSGASLERRERFDLPPAGLLRGLCFGYNELGADFLWLRTISYFADEIGGERDFTCLPRYLHHILALDDRFRAVYRYGATMLVVHNKAATNEEVEEAISLLKRAAALWPDDWNFPLSIGSYYMSELRPLTPAQKRRFRREAADWVMRASLVGADIPWLPSLAAKIYTEQGERELAIHHLEELYLTTPDEATRTQIYWKLKSMTDARDQALLEEQARAFRKAYEGSDLRFVPPDLFVLIEDNTLKPFDLDRKGGTFW